MRTFISLLSVITLLSLPVLSVGEVYRSVDEAGNVTYTDTPPEEGAQVERVELPPPPSPERLRQSEQRHQEILRAAEKSKIERQQQRVEREANISQARNELAEAEARLEQAKIIQDEDRQNLSGGKRRIHPDYFARVKKAEAEVEAARKKLREVRGY
jgi:multidrug efflux pump subunit AcrA (membrane-fusion protein)